MRNLLAKIKKRPGILAAVIVFLVTVGVAAAVVISRFNIDDITIDSSGRRQAATQADEQSDASAGTQGASDISGLDTTQRGESLIQSVTASTAGNGKNERLIKTDTEFILTTREDVEPSVLKKHVTLSAKTDFTIAKTAPNTYTLKTTQPLPEGSIIRVELNAEDGVTERRWAFQTESEFKVTSVFPADGSTYVPIETGIEISFSYEPELNNIAEYFEITPHVNGQFQKFRGTIAFIPASDLDEDTEYTVTLKAGLMCEQGFSLKENTAFTFKTHNTYWSRDYFFPVSYTGGFTGTFLKGDPCLVQIRCSESLKDRDIDLTLYQYPSADAYKAALKESADTGKPSNPSQINGLNEVYSSKTKLAYADTDYGYGAYYLFFPDNLEEGYYIACMQTSLDGKDYSAYYNIQINPISVFTASIPDETIFFINDTATGAAAMGANITIEYDDKSGKAVTTSDGTARIKTDADKYGRGVMVIEYNGYTYVDHIDLRQTSERRLTDDYYIYMYTDREIYTTTDTIEIWGVVIPRTEASPPAAGLRAELQQYVYTGYKSENVSLAGSDITLNRDGSFTASLEYSSIKGSWANVALCSGETVVSSRYVTIEDYVKPLYVMQAEAPFSLKYPLYNQASVSAGVNLFEGTPAKDTKVEITTSTDSKTVTIDENGGANVNIRFSDRDAWRPESQYISFALSGVENEYQYINKTVYTLSRDIMLEADFSTNSLSILTSRVNMDDFDERMTTKRGEWTVTRESEYFYANQYFSYTYEETDYTGMLRGEPVDITVTGKLTRTWYEKVVTGTSYDFITKRNYETFRYDRKEEDLGTYSVTTVNGKAVFSSLPVLHADSSYTMQLEWYDTMGNLTRQTEYLNSSVNYYYGNNNTRSIYYLKGGENFTDEQNASFELYNSGEVVTSRGGRLLFTVSDKEFLTVEVKNNTSFTHTMKSEYIPNVYIGGAYFDGKRVYTVFYAERTYNPKERELTVSFNADKTTYAPSDTATITVTARDKNGAAVSGAAVSVSVVDEAVFALREQRVTTLTSLYAAVGIPYVRTYTSYIEYTLDGIDDAANAGAEMGDGNDGARSTFVDTAAFLTGVTDANGTAVFSVKLPDNITAWRVTAQIIGEKENKLYAGHEISPVYVSKPLFITANAPPLFILGDDIAFTARLRGTEQKSVQTTIQAVLSGNQQDARLSGGINAQFNFGKQDEGTYTLNLSANESGYSDTLILEPISVVQTALEVPVKVDFVLNNGIPAITPLRSPVGLYFYNNEYVFHNEVLKTLQAAWDTRLEYRVASAYAAFEYGYITEDDFKNALSDITSAPLLSIYPYAEQNYKLTALTAAAVPGIISPGTARMFSSRLYSKDITVSDASVCLLGLAALNEPVLIDIIDVLENENGLTVADTLRLCAAAALLGDEDTAYRYYFDATNGLITQNDNTAYISINGDKNADSTEKTSLALITASVLNLPDAEPFAKYLLYDWRVGNHEQTIFLELITYLKYYTPKTENEAVFSYTKNGIEQTVTLKRLRGTALGLTADEFLNADFKVISGEVGCAVNYTGRITDEKRTQTLNVTKTYTPIDGNWLPGALVQVTIKADSAPFGRFMFYDVIPSGARFDEAVTNQNELYPKNNGQHISGFTPKPNGTVTYYIRLVTPGEFVSESAAVYGFNDTWGYSQKSTITILKDS